MTDTLDAVVKRFGISLDAMHDWIEDTDGLRSQRAQEDRCAKETELTSKLTAYIDWFFRDDLKNGDYNNTSARLFEYAVIGSPCMWLSRSEPSDRASFRFIDLDLGIYCTISFFGLKKEEDKQPKLPPNYLRNISLLAQLLRLCIFRTDCSYSSELKVSNQGELFSMGNSVIIDRQREGHPGSIIVIHVEPLCLNVEIRSKEFPILGHLRPENSVCYWINCEKDLKKELRSLTAMYKKDIAAKRKEIKEVQEKLNSMNRTS